MGEKMKQRYLSNAAGVAILTLISQILGYVREMLFAYYLGTSNQVEAFQVAETIPLLFTQILISAVPLAVTPLFVREQLEKKDDLIHTALFCFGVIVIILAGMVWKWPELFVGAMAPGFKGEKYILTCRLVVLLSPNIVFLSLAAVFNSYINANKQFIIPAASGLLLNGSIIVMQLITKENVEAVAVGSACGGILMFLVTLFYCLQKYRFRPSVQRIRLGKIKLILKAVLPVCVISSFTSINLVLDKYFASGIGDGTVALLSYSYKIINLPVYIFVTSITKVMLPDITQMALDGEKEALVKVVKRVILLCFLLGALSLAGIYVLGEWGVSILFGRGAFQENDVVETARILRLYSFGITGMALNSFFQSVSYAREKFFEPFKVLGIQILVYLIIVSNTIHIWGIRAIVLGNVIAVSGSIVVWLIVFKKSIGIEIDRTNKMK